MSKNINIHIKTPGAGKAKRDLDSVGQSSKNVGQTVKDSSRKGAKEVDKLRNSTDSAKGAFGKFAGSLTSWVVKLASIATAIRLVTSAIRSQIEAMQEHARIAAEQQKSLVELQFLGGFFRERPELQKEVATLAEFGRRPFQEVAGAWYSLRSKGAGLSEQQQSSILREALELGRTTPSTPLGTLIDMFSLYAKRTGVQDANRVQNVLNQTITEAGGTAADVASYMPQFLPIGMSGGLSGAETAGLWSYVTTQLADASIATTGMRSTFMGLQGRGSPEGQRLLKRFGINKGMDFFEKIARLSQRFQSGKFSLGHAELIAGREGAPVLLSILQNPAAMMQTVGNVVGADTGQFDITQDMIADLMGTDERARLEEQTRLLDVELANIKGGDIGAMRWNVYLKAYEKAMRLKGVPEAVIQTQKKFEQIKAGFGLSSGDLAGWTTPFAWGNIRPESPPIIINDQSTNYYPRIGSDERGPRFSQD